MNLSDYFPIIKEKNDKCNNYLIETNPHNILNEFENNKKIIVLLCGEVQSGKTRNIINIIKESFESYSYNLVIFLCGTNNNLKNQSILRVENNEELNKKNKINMIENINYYDEYSNNLLMLLKEKNNLEKTYEYLCHNIHILNKKKILIIDDESDYASINTSRDINQTKIYDLINKTYEELNNVGMLLVTATPFANIMTTKTTNQASSIYTLKSPDEYTGISFFNSLNDFYLCDHSMLEINLNELDKLILFSFFVWIYQSYSYFKENNSEKSTLLIYCSDEKNEHEKYKNIIYEQVVNFKGLYKNSFEKFIKNKYKVSDRNEINEITQWIINQKLEKQIFILNSDQKDKSNSIENINSQKLSIVIGGVMLSCGITYENLLTELFLYCSNNDVNCDVLLQRCRWFGYRQTSKNGLKNNRYKYMNLITKNNIVDNLREVEKFNDILFWNSGHKIDIKETCEQIKNLENNSNLGATNNVKK